MHKWIFSRHSRFLPQFRRMHVILTNLASTVDISVYFVNTTWRVCIFSLWMYGLSRGTQLLHIVQNMHADICIAWWQYFCEWWWVCVFLCRHSHGVTYPRTALHIANISIPQYQCVQYSYLKQLKGSCIPVAF